MKAVIEFILSNISAAFYLTALTFLIAILGHYDVLLANVKQNINENYVLYEQEKEETESGLISYQELYSLLFRPLEYDISINGNEIDKENYDYMLFDLSQIERSAYRKTYLYGENGKIRKIMYEEVGEEE